eukprot:322561-Chlamydomonas_euryale.AAC.13
MADPTGVFETMECRAALRAQSQCENHPAVRYPTNVAKIHVPRCVEKVHGLGRSGRCTHLRSRVEAAV